MTTYTSFVKKWARKGLSFKAIAKKWKAKKGNPRKVRSPRKAQRRSVKPMAKRRRRASTRRSSRRTSRRGGRRSGGRGAMGMLNKAGYGMAVGTGVLSLSNYYLAKLNINAGPLPEVLAGWTAYKSAGGKLIGSGGLAALPFAGAAGFDVLDMTLGRLPGAGLGSGSGDGHNW